MRCDSRARLHLAERAAGGAHHRGLASSAYLQRCGGTAELVSVAQERCSLAVAAAETCCVYSAARRRTRFFLHYDLRSENGAPPAPVFASYSNLSAAKWRLEQVYLVALKTKQACAGVVTVERRRDIRSGSRPPKPVIQTP